MSNDARHRDIAALLARGVIRVKQQPTFAKTDKSTTPAEQASSGQPPNPVNIEAEASQIQAQDGGNQ
jgi:hypothetical protein